MLIRLTPKYTIGSLAAERDAAMPAVVLLSADLPFPGSLPEFQRLFPDDTACAAYLEATRWRDGFVCGWCGEASEPYRFANRPQVLRCRKCQRDNALTARHGHGADPHAAVDLVLGRLPGFEPYARHLGRPIPAPAWLEPLRDGVPDAPQTPRRHGPTRSRPHRWPAAGSCRDRRVMGRWQDAQRGPRRP